MAAHGRRGFPPEITGGVVRYSVAKAAQKISEAPVQLKAQTAPALRDDFPEKGIRLQRGWNIPENIQILVGNRGAVRQMELSQQCGIRDNFFRHFQSQPMKIRIYVHLLTSSRISMTVSSCSRET